MYIGLGIVLLVAGLVLAFNVINVDLHYVNADALGIILIIWACSRSCCRSR